MELSFTSGASSRFFTNCSNRVSSSTYGLGILNIEMAAMPCNNYMREVSNTPMEQKLNQSNLKVFLDYKLEIRKRRK